MKSSDLEPFGKAALELGHAYRRWVEEATANIIRAMGLPPDVLDEPDQPAIVILPGGKDSPCSGPSATS